MGYIEELAAREAARQNENRAKQAEAAGVLNMNAGLAASVRPSQGYQANGLTDREANEVAQREAIAKRAYEQAAADRYLQSQEYAATLRDAGQAGWDGSSGVVVPQGNIDQGLAAKWRESYR